MTGSAQLKSLAAFVALSLWHGPAIMVITVNGNVCEIEAPATIADLLRQLQIDAQQVAVEVNLDLIPRQRHAEHSLSAGDCLEIVSLVGGG